MIAKQIASKISPELLIGAYAVNDRDLICSRIQYPNGDAVTAYVVNDRNVTRFSDFGVTLALLDRAGVDLTERRLEIINYVLKARGLVLSSDRAILAEPVTPENAAELFREFCIGISNISMMEFDREPHVRTTYVPKVDLVLRNIAPPKSEVRRRFVYEQLDPDSLYPIDWAIATPHGNKHVFAITGRESALMMPATVNFFKNKKLVVPTIALFSPDLRLPKRHVTRIQHAAEQLFFKDVAEGQELIRKWLKAA